MANIFLRSLALVPVAMFAIIAGSVIAYLGLVAWLHLGERGEEEGEE